MCCMYKMNPLFFPFSITYKDMSNVMPSSVVEKNLLSAYR